MPLAKHMNNVWHVIMEPNWTMGRLCDILSYITETCAHLLPRHTWEQPWNPRCFLHGHLKVWFLTRGICNFFLGTIMERGGRERTISMEKITTTIPSHSTLNSSKLRTSAETFPRKTSNSPRKISAPNIELAHTLSTETFIFFSIEMSMQRYGSYVKPPYNQPKPLTHNGILSLQTNIATHPTSRQDQFCPTFNPPYNLTVPPYRLSWMTCSHASRWSTQGPLTIFLGVYSVYASIFPHSHRSPSFLLLIWTYQSNHPTLITIE